MLKAYKHDMMYDVLLTDTIPNIEGLKEQLNKTSIFRKIILLRRKDYFSKEYHTYLMSFLNCRINRKKICRKMSFLNQYSDIYIFNDYTEIGSYLSLHNIGYHLLEDGLDLFKQYDVYQDIGHGYHFKKILYRLFKIPYSVGMTKQCIDVEVNNDNDLKTDIKQKVIALSRKVLESQIDEQYKKLIFLAFNVSPIKLSSRNVLILTQVLSERSITKTSKGQYQFYEDIVKRYYEKYSIYLKAHPRDQIDYSNLTRKYNVICMKKEVPIELYTHIQGIYFDYIITYSSTAANSDDMGRNIIRLDE